MRLDSSGNIIWQKRYGVAEYDAANCIQQTQDGGYIVAGATSNFGAGGRDFWVLKLDSFGNVIWQKTYGGTGDDYAYSVQQTQDGGYIVAGMTYSFGAGIWVLKLDSSGNIIWQKTYGGTFWDYAFSIQQTQDGGYIVAGVTNSFGAGNEDSWVLKLDSSGNIIWQKSYGGTGGDQAYTVQQTNDGGYIIAGTTYSFGAGRDDFWVLKLDSQGNCSTLGKDTNATVQNTSAIVTDTNATVTDTQATVTNTTATVTNTNAIVQTQSAPALVYSADFALNPDSYNFENWPISKDTLWKMVREIVSSTFSWLAPPTRLPANQTTGAKLEQTRIAPALVAGLVIEVIVGKIFIDLAFLNGHCYGMSATSILYKKDPSLKPVQKPTYEMQKTDPGVIEKIAIYHKSQLASVIKWKWIKNYFEPMTPERVSSEYEYIKDMIKNQKKPVLLALPDHAVVGYKIIENPVTNVHNIIIYDNNYPDEEREGTFDLAAGKFSYDGYDIVHASYPTSWVLADMSSQLRNALVEFFTGLLQNAVAGFKKLLWHCEVRPLVKDGEGRQTGYVDDAIVNEIPGASIEILPDKSIIITVPENIALSSEVKGTKEETFDFGIICSTTSKQLQNYKQVELGVSVITYEAVPVTASTIVTAEIKPGEVPTLNIDKDGDGQVDETKIPTNEQSLLAQQIPHALSKGLQMVSIPLQLYYPDPPTLFSIEPTSLKLAKWQSVNGQAKYYYYSEDPENPVVGTIQPFQGYWVKFDEPIDIVAKGLLPDQQGEQSMKLQVGWNQIGNPFLDAVGWDLGKLQVQQGTNLPLYLNNPDALKLVEDYAWLGSRTKVILIPASMCSSMIQLVLTYRVC